MSRKKSHALQKRKNVTTLVIGGGANRGIMMGGALACLEDRNILRQIKTFIGSSIGALMCALLSVGYTSREIIQLIVDHDFSNAKPSNENEIYNIFMRYACYSNTRMNHVVREIIAKRADIPTLTLRQLHDVYHRTLVVTACCVNSGKTVYFSYHTHPDMPIYVAVCMSMTIPLVFQPYEYDGSLYVDGCTFGHDYPVYWPLLKKDTMIGFRLFSQENKAVKVESLLHYVKLLAYGFIATENSKEHPNTITLFCNVDPFADTVAREIKKKLMDRAYAAVCKWL